MPGEVDPSAFLGRKPRLTIGLAYYYPYTSGLTEAAGRLAEELVERGWDVHVVTTQHDRDLGRHTVVGGVSVRRCRAIMSAGRAPVSPSFAISLIRSAWQSDVTLLHLPLPEAGLVAALVPKGRLYTFYHCDPASLQVPGEAALLKILDASSRVALRRSRHTITTSTDYAEHSRLAEEFERANVVIPPPCVERRLGEPTFRETERGIHVGFLGRIVEEKGLRYLVEAFRSIDDPDARLLVGGDFDELAGGSVISSVSRAAGGDPRIRFLGFIDDDRIPDFYASLDVFVLSSIDSFEAFGIVQVEALMAGVPVISTDLPGVRTVAAQLGVGKVVPRRDSKALGRALREMAATPSTAMRADLRAAATSAYGVKSVTTRLERTLLEAVSDKSERRAARQARAQSGPRSTKLFSDEPLVEARVQTGWLFERRVQRILEFLSAAEPDDLVLEIGCGTGAVLERLAQARPDLRLCGIEPVDSYAAFARERLGGTDPERVQVLSGYMHDMPGSDVKGVDWVISNNMLHHATDVDAILEALALVCGESAKWLSIEPNAQNPWVYVRHFTQSGDRLFSKQEFLEKATDAGWSLRAAGHLFLYPPSFRQVGPIAARLERLLERNPVLSGGIVLEIALSNHSRGTE